MTEAPNTVDEKQLEELFIKSTLKNKNKARKYFLVFIYFLF